MLSMYLPPKHPIIAIWNNKMIAKITRSFRTGIWWDIHYCKLFLETVFAMKKANNQANITKQCDSHLLKPPFLKQKLVEQFLAWPFGKSDLEKVLVHNWKINTTKIAYVSYDNWSGRNNKTMYQVILVVTSNYFMKQLPWKLSMS